MCNDMVSRYINYFIPIIDIILYYYEKGNDIIDHMRDPYIDKNWLDIYHMCNIYEIKNNTNIKKNTEYNNIKIGDWIYQQSILYKNDKLKKNYEILTAVNNTVR